MVTEWPGVAGGDLLDVADGAGGHERGGLRGRVDAPRDGSHVRQDEYLHHLGAELLQMKHIDFERCTSSYQRLYSGSC